MDSVIKSRLFQGKKGYDVCANRGKSPRTDKFERGRTRQQLWGIRNGQPVAQLAQLTELVVFSRPYSAQVITC